MKIGLMADTHDNLPRIGDALAVFAERGVKHIVHAGDFIAPFALKKLLAAGLPVSAVFGNNDGERNGLRKLLPRIAGPPARFDIAGVHFVVTHDIALLTDEARQSADVILYAHTHEVMVEAGPPVLVNPGECGGWLRGTCTVAVLDTDGLDIDIITL